MTTQPIDLDAVEARGARTVSEEELQHHLAGAGKMIPAASASSTLGGANDQFMSAHDMVRPTLRAVYTCVYGPCSDQHLALDPAAAEQWMDEHAREVAHPRQWPITFRVDYSGAQPSVAYRDPVKLTTLPPVQCKPWCYVADGHPDQIHRQDQYCMSGDLRVELSRHPSIEESRYNEETGAWEPGPDYILVDAQQEPDDAEPFLMIRRECDEKPVVSWEFTPDEARQLIENLQLLLGQVAQ